MGFNQSRSQGSGGGKTPNQAKNICAKYRVPKTRIIAKDQNKYGFLTLSSNLAPRKPIDINTNITYIIKNTSRQNQMLNIDIILLITNITRKINPSIVKISVVMESFINEIICFSFFILTFFSAFFGERYLLRAIQTYTLYAISSSLGGNNLSQRVVNRGTITSQNISPQTKVINITSQGVLLGAFRILFYVSIIINTTTSKYINHLGDKV
tara:strand:- start:1770 stop:2402 length:633 start_codon:yes stop_codon:yes gene_type:complete